MCIYRTLVIFPETSKAEAAKILTKFRTECDNRAISESQTPNKNRVYTCQWKCDARGQHVDMWGKQYETTDTHTKTIDYFISE